MKIIKIEFPYVCQDKNKITYLSFIIAIDLDDCNVIGYTAWSLLDNFEWEMGYVERFGMHYIDFDDPERQRTPKASAIYYTQIIADNGFPEPPTPTTTPSSPTSGSDEILSTTFTLFALLASGIFMWSIFAYPG